MSADDCGCCGCLCGRLGRVMPSNLLLKLNQLVASGITGVNDPQQIAGCRLTPTLPFTWEGDVRVFNAFPLTTAYDLIHVKLTCPAAPGSPCPGGVDSFSGLTYNSYNLHFSWTFGGGGSLDVSMKKYDVQASPSCPGSPPVTGCLGCAPLILRSCTTGGVSTTFNLPLGNTIAGFGVTTVEAVINAFHLDSVGYLLGVGQIKIRQHNPGGPDGFSPVGSLGGKLERMTHGSWYGNSLGGSFMFGQGWMNGGGGVANATLGITALCDFEDVYVDGWPGATFAGLNGVSFFSRPPCCPYNQPASVFSPVVNLHCSDFDPWNLNAFTVLACNVSGDTYCINCPNSDPGDGVTPWCEKDGYDFFNAILAGQVEIATPQVSYGFGNPRATTSPFTPSSAIATDDPGQSPCWPMPGLIRYVIHSTGFGDGLGGVAVFGTSWYSLSLFLPNIGAAANIGWHARPAGAPGIFIKGDAGYCNAGGVYGVPGVYPGCVSTLGTRMLAFLYTGPGANTGGGAVSMISCRPFYATTTPAVFSAAPWSGATVWLELFEV